MCPDSSLQYWSNPYLAAYSSWWTTVHAAEWLSADSGVPDLSGGPEELLAAERRHSVPSGIRARMRHIYCLLAFGDAGCKIQDADDTRGRLPATKGIAKMLMIPGVASP